MKKLIILGVLIFPLCVFSQDLLNDLKFSAFIGEGMGSGFGVETNRDEFVNYSFSVGKSEIIYGLDAGNSFLEYSSLFQNRISYTGYGSTNSYYLYDYSSLLHFTFLTDMTVLHKNGFLFQFDAGVQFRWYLKPDKLYINNTVNIGLSPDPEYVNREYHALNFGFISTVKVSFFNNKKFSPFLSYGGFVDVIDASKFRWLHVFQVGVFYNWCKIDEERI
ncbi:MAG: hypothetical protein JXR53_09390 [Bacteroidales bacterium]|nr:hypothetical protein [Bacteroidales bacterium]